MSDVNSLEKKINQIDKKLDAIMDAQKKFYPLYQKNFVDLIKGFAKLNESAGSMSNMFGLVGSMMEDHKDVIEQVASQFGNLELKQPEKEQKSKEE